MEIRLITSNKKQFLDLLLLADEQESMIDKYLERGEMFALYDDGLKAISVSVQEIRLLLFLSTSIADFVSHID